ncbi:hypothetical protein C8Q75DRAFT_521008 [Abortiporus biennis]|nr:hypothetical protein C8Q75DRAFT_521008 [Abortiporus biennis]
MASNAAALPKLDNTFGAMFIGLIIVAIMYGITCVQTYMYYTRYKNDSHIMKFLVFVLWNLDTTQLALVSQMLYHYLILNYANPVVLADIAWSFPVETIITTINDGIIRCIYAHRIWKLTRNKWATIIILMMTLTVSSLCLAIVVRMFQLKTFENLAHVRNLIIVALLSVAVIDASIASVLCHNLLQRRSGFSKRTDTQLQVLIKYAIHTALLTSIIAIVSVVAYISMPHNLIFIGSFVTLPKFFLNSLLATLNSRDDLRNGFDKSGSESVQLSKISVGASAIVSHTTPGQQDKMFDIGVVKVDREEVSSQEYQTDTFTISGLHHQDGESKRDYKV